jgi:para-aminobenzoate synthetase component 1
MLDFNISIIDEQIISTGVSTEQFLAAAAPLLAQPDSIALVSGGDHPLSRFYILACQPLLKFASKGNSNKLTIGTQTDSWSGDPFSALDQLIEQLPKLDQKPCHASLFGYLAYELKNHLESLPQTASDDLGLPESYFIFPSNVFILDHGTGELRQLRFALAGEEPEECQFDITNTLPELVDFAQTDIGSNFSKQSYLKAFTEVKDYIVEGDIYQVNLTQRLDFSFSDDPFLLFLKMFKENPAPFYAFLNAGDHQVVSSSMERFLYRNGSYLETRPIKGTAPRDEDMAIDAKLKSELMADPKEEAELSMIVDLLRNDIGKVCLPGSVAVEQHKAIESYSNVHHLVSTVTGEIDSQTSNIDILRATFPGGSISGCPKIRAMEIIDELEPNVRHIYTGSIGYIGKEIMDLNIAIRTAIITSEKGYYGTGGGIVYDSSAESEYAETMTKAKTIIAALKREK